MPSIDTFWQRKIDAFLSRVPGELNARGTAEIRMADQVAFALHPRSTHTAAVWPSADALLVEHPLTGERIFLEGLGETDWDVVSAAVRDRAVRIQAVHGGNLQHQYYALWRLMAEPPRPADLPSLSPALGANLRRAWRVLPARPDMPSCLLWEHQSLVAALAATATADGELKPALLQFNIADTQAFVTRARRTQDLWAGSYLLSYLCWCLLKTFADRYGPDCVLQPSLRGQPLADLWLQTTFGPGIGPSPLLSSGWIPLPDPERLMVSNIPNIFTVILPEADIEEAVEEAIRSAQSQWQEISGTVREAFHKAARSTGLDWSGCDAIWTRQEQSFFRDNLFWAALPLPAGPLNQAGLAEWRARYGRFLPDQPEVYAHLEQEIDARTEDSTGGLLYGLCSQLTAQLLSDRKRVRDFTQVTEPGQKCSLSGTLQAVYPIPRPGADELRFARQWWETLAGFDGRGFHNRSQFKMAGRIRRGDRLCAIQATRRLMLQTFFGTGGPSGVPFDRHQFPSTAGIANAHLLGQIALQAREGAVLRSALRAYIAAVCGGLLTQKYYYPASLLPAWEHVAAGDPLLKRFLRMDAEYLLEDFYLEDSLTREFGDEIARISVGGRDFPQRLEAAQKSRNLLAQLTGAKPTRYYAVIAMDGDSMGQWISGRKTPSRPLGPALHMAFTRGLSSFALDDVRRIVEMDHFGKLIYAGGDDVLAFMPVTDLLPVMDELYQAFRGVERPSTSGTQAAFSGFATSPEEILELRMGNATLSAGAVIVHEAVPLSYALEQVRAAERQAKEQYGRDAFVVRLLRRSGAPVEVGAKWRVDGINVPQAVRSVAAQIEKGSLSSKVGYSMAGSRLEAANTWEPKALREAQRGEFRRLSYRSILADREAVVQALEPMARLVGMADPENTPITGKTVGWEDSWAAVQGLLRLARAIGEQR